MHKLCDGADWFRGDLDRIIRSELREAPRLNRKQWEFAVIYRELERLGMLDGQREGISFGSGTEQILYALAHRVRHLWATDVYGPETEWDIACTRDPSAHVRQRAPFPFPEAALSARAMDMRQVEFPDESFDFAYSSCAIEHIGHPPDFIQHLREVRRVLKPGGVYVLTTEFTFREAAVEVKHGYVFSRALLQEIVAASGLAAARDFDATLTPNGVNFPLPLELSAGRNDSPGRFHERLFAELSHLQLSVANTPYTSCVVVLRKTDEPFEGFRYNGFEASARFVSEAMERLRCMVEESDLLLHPFAHLPGRRSRRFIGHEEFFTGRGAADAAPADDPHLFHTAYMWLGSRPRLLRVSLSAAAAGELAATVRVHRESFSDSWGVVQPDVEVEVRGAGGRARVEIPLEPRADCRYAVLAVQRRGATVRLDDVSVSAMAAGTPRAWSDPVPALPVHRRVVESSLSHLRGVVRALPPSSPLRRLLKSLRPPSTR